MIKRWWDIQRSASACPQTHHTSLKGLINASETLKMSQYTHYSEITPEIAEVIGKLPPYASNGDFKADRDAAHAMMQASLDAQKEFLPPGKVFGIVLHAWLKTVS